MTLYYGWASGGRGRSEADRYTTMIETLMPPSGISASMPLQYEVLLSATESCTSFYAFRKSFVLYRRDDRLYLVASNRRVGRQPLTLVTLEVDRAYLLVYANQYSLPSPRGYRERVRAHLIAVANGVAYTPPRQPRRITVAVDANRLIQWRGD